MPKKKTESKAAGGSPKKAQAIPRGKRPDRFSKEVALSLAGKQKYIDRDIAGLVMALQESPLLKNVFLKKGSGRRFAKETVFNIRKKHGIPPAGRSSKTRKHTLDPAALKMARNLFWATELTADEISSLLKSAGKPISNATVRSLMHEEGRMVRHFPGAGKQRTKRVSAYRKAFKSNSARKNLGIWFSLNASLHALKRARNCTKNKAVKASLNERMSGLHERLEAIEPLLPEKLREKLAAEFIQRFDAMQA